MNRPGKHHIPYTAGHRSHVIQSAQSSCSPSRAGPNPTSSAPPADPTFTAQSPPTPCSTMAQRASPSAASNSDAPSCSWKNTSAARAAGEFTPSLGAVPRLISRYSASHCRKFVGSDGMEYKWQSTDGHEWSVRHFCPPADLHELTLGMCS